MAFWFTYRWFGEALDLGRMDCWKRMAGSGGPGRNGFFFFLVWRTAFLRCTGGCSVYIMVDLEMGIGIPQQTSFAKYSFNWELGLYFSLRLVVCVKTYI
jgi:hypothetical protein